MNTFFQFVHDSVTLLNKDKYQAFGMQFTDMESRHNNVVYFSLRQTLTYKADKVAELSQESFSEWFDKEFNDFFSLSA